MKTWRACPTCGQKLPLKQFGVPMPAKKARIIDMILRAGSEGAPCDAVYQRLFSHTSRNTVKAHIWQINELLAETGYRIVAGKRGANYKLQGPRAVATGSLFDRAAKLRRTLAVTPYRPRIKPHVAYCFRSGEVGIARQIPPGTRWLLLEGDPVRLFNFLAVITQRIDHPEGSIMAIPGVRYNVSEEMAAAALLDWMRYISPLAQKAGLLPRKNKRNEKRFWASLKGAEL